MKSPFLFLIILSFYACNHKSDKKIIPKLKQSNLPVNTVTYIVDGDTFDMVDSNNNIIRIRPIGIDTDEIKDNSHGKKGPYAVPAKEYLSKLIYHKIVRLEMDVQKKDQYDRVLAYVFVNDTTFVNAEMIKHGYAVMLTIPPNIKYVDYFYQLQQEAREAKKGMWETIIE